MSLERIRLNCLSNIEPEICSLFQCQWHHTGGRGRQSCKAGWLESYPTEPFKRKRKYVVEGGKEQFSNNFLKEGDMNFWRETRNLLRCLPLGGTSLSCSPQAECEARWVVRDTLLDAS